MRPGETSGIAASLNIQLGCIREGREELVQIAGFQVPRILFVPWEVWGWSPSPACHACPQVYSSMERLSLLEERRTPPPTKRSLSEEKEDRSDGLTGLKGRDRSWVIGSPEM